MSGEQYHTDQEEVVQESTEESEEVPSTPVPWTTAEIVNVC